MDLLIHNLGRGVAGNEDWNRGDIVMVKPHGWNWGGQEDPRSRTDDPVDLFAILWVPGLALGIDLKANLLTTYIDTDEDSTLLARGLWRVDMDNLPTGVADQIAIDGWATIGWGVLKQNIVYIPDGVSTGEDIDPEAYDPTAHRG